MFVGFTVKVGQFLGVSVTGCAACLCFCEDVSWFYRYVLTLHMLCHQTYLQAV